MLIPLVDVLSLVPVPRSTLYVLMQRNDFPKSIKIGKRVFWDDAEVAAWVQLRKDLRNEAA